MSLSLIADAYLIESEDDGEAFEEEFDLSTLDNAENNQESVQGLDKDKVNSEVDKNDKESGNDKTDLKIKSSFGFENVRVNLNKTWPFNHCRLIISQSDDQEAQEFDPYAKENWVLQGTKHVFRDFITSEEVKEIGEEVEKLGELLPEPPGLEFFKNPIQSELGKFYSSATQGHKEKEKNVNCHKYHLRQKRKLNAKIVEESSHKEIKKSRKDISPGSNRKEIKNAIPPGTKLDVNPTNPDIPPKSSSPKPFKCPFCFKLYLEAKDLICHLKTHTQSKTKTASVSSNQANHDSGIPDASPDSGNGSEDESPKRSNKTGRWSCVIGGATFWRSYNLDNHRDENRFKCPLCRKGFSQLSLIKAHISEVHGEGRTLIRLLESPKSKRLNVEATKSSSRDGGLLRPCQIILKRCDYMMKTNPMKESTVGVHNSSSTERSIHSRNQTASKGPMKRTSGYQPVISNNDSANEISDFKSSEETFSCTKCPKSFSNARNLRFHMNSHGNAHRCPHCNKGFNCQSYLSRHLPVHQKPTPSTVPEGSDLCPYCNKLFSDSNNFNEHLKLHRREAPYKCSICSKFYMTKNNLACHKYQNHSKKSSYECTHCSKKFKTKTSLSLHLLVHTGAKPYQCPRCPKKFNRNDIFKEHLMRHDGIKSFGCPVCMKTFVVRADLNQHKLVHSDATPYKCSECSASFKRSTFLKQHQKKHLPNMNIPKRMEQSIPPTE